jgi:hypothetical protein
MIRIDLDPNRVVEFRVKFERFADSYGKLNFKRFSIVYKNRFNDWLDVRDSSYSDGDNTKYLSLRDAIFDSMFRCRRFCRIEIPDTLFDWGEYNLDHEWFSYCISDIMLGVESNKCFTNRNVSLHITFSKYDNIYLDCRFDVEYNVYNIYYLYDIIINVDDKITQVSMIERKKFFNIFRNLSLQGKI